MPDYIENLFWASSIPKGSVSILKNRFFFFQCDERIYYIAHGQYWLFTVIQNSEALENVSNGSLVRPLAHSLVLLTRLLALHWSLCSLTWFCDLISGSSWPRSGSEIWKMSWLRRWKTIPLRGHPPRTPRARPNGWHVTRVLEAEAVVFVSHFQIGGWDSY